MKQFIRDYLTFNKRERNGLFVLFSIITLLIIYLNISNKFIETVKVDFTKFEKEIEQFNASVKLINDSLKNESQHKYTHLNEESREAKRPDNTVNKQPEHFTFNPNNLSDTDWQRLGLAEKQIQTIKNYESKGGKFRYKEDVKKMYCISEKQYLSLEPYIQIPIEKKIFKEFETTKSSDKNPKTSFTIVELNSADSTQLTHIKGIGSFYAKTIIKYRNSLGGFVAKVQLMEMWKFDFDKFEEIEKYIILDVSQVKKININTCTAAELKHPYISWNAANGIFNYRTNHGKYKTLEEIKKTDLVDDETYRKIASYLILE